MPQTLNQRNQGISVQSATRADLRPINPASIKISQEFIPDTKKVEKIVQILKNKGSLPDIIITPSNELIYGIDALEAAKQVGQPIILASIQKVKIESSKIPLADIKLDGGTQSRAGINNEAIAEYVQAWKEGTTFPLVVIFYDGENYWLADGFHRCLSAKQAGLTEIEADIRQGTRRDAVLYSVGANAQHGLRRTNEDKRRAVINLLNDEEWKQWSDREIARRTGVHHDTVGRIRAELSGGIRQITDEERKANRGGTTYTQKASKNKTWTPKETEEVEIIGGEFKGKRAEVRVICGSMAMCLVDGDEENKRRNIRLSDMQPIKIDQEKPITSTKQEIKQKQQDLGLGKSEQVFPDVQRNEGFNPAEVNQQVATVVNLNAFEDVLVGELATAILRLDPKQLHEVMCKVEPDLTTSQLEAIWKALKNHFTHKVA